MVGCDIFCDLLVVFVGGDRLSLVNVDRFDIWNVWVKDVDFDVVVWVFELLNEGIDWLMIGIQFNVKLLLEYILIVIGEWLSGCVVLVLWDCYWVAVWVIL